MLRASSGFDYILVKADTAGLSIKMIEKRTPIKDFLDYKEKNTPNTALVKELYTGKVFNAMRGTLDKAEASKILVDNPTWHVCPGFPDGGTYSGMDEVFGSFYANIPIRYCLFYGEPEVFIDTGDIVTVLGYYNFKIKEDDPVKRARFSHTRKIAADGRIAGVWQVADSHVIQECFPPARHQDRP